MLGPNTVLLREELGVMSLCQLHVTVPGWDTWQECVSWITKVNQPISGSVTLITSASLLSITYHSHMLWGPRTWTSLGKRHCVAHPKASRARIQAFQTTFLCLCVCGFVLSHSSMGAQDVGGTAFPQYI